MRKSTLAIATLAVLGMLFTSVAFTYSRLAGTGEKMTVNAAALVESLDADQKKIALYPYEASERLGWHFIPKDERKGLQIKFMNEDQREKATALLQSALSQVGYQKTTEIMANEGLLKEVQDSGPLRDTERYYFTIFGEPKAGARWGLSYEGHHLSLNFVIEGDKVISSTPQFFATNPAVLMEQYSDQFPKGMATLKDEENLAFELVNGLSADQLKTAVIAEKCPGEIRAAGEAQPPQTKAEGIVWGELDKDQQQLLKKLIYTYISAVPSDVDAQRMADIEKSGWDKIHFAWAGGKKAGVPHYYRVQGESFLIEFVNAQPDVAGNPANHIHCVWRDMRGDFALPAEG